MKIASPFQPLLSSGIPYMPTLCYHSLRGPVGNPRVAVRTRKSHRKPGIRLRYGT